MNIPEAIQQLKKGSKPAFKHIVYQYSGRFIKVAARYTRDLEEAKDVLQDSFILIYENIHQLKGSDEISFQKWAKKIIVRTALRKYQRKYYSHEKDEISFNSHPKTDPEIYSQLNTEFISKQIENLPEGYRHVFTLFAIEDYSHKEIAELLNIQESTSRSQYLRARRMLQLKLSQQHKAYVK